MIESGAGNAAVIKSHHNVGGLPDYVDFKEIIEPLRLLFKDEVVSWAGSWACLSTWSPANPSPDQALPSASSGTSPRKRRTTLRQADFIFRDEIAGAGLTRPRTSTLPYLPTPVPSA